MSSSAVHGRRTGAARRTGVARRGGHEQLGSPHYRRTGAARRSAIGGRNLTVVPYGVTCSRRTAHVSADRLNSWRADDDARTQLAATYRSAVTPQLGYTFETTYRCSPACPPIPDVQVLPAVQYRRSLASGVRARCTCSAQPGPLRSSAARLMDVRTCCTTRHSARRTRRACSAWCLTYRQESSGGRRRTGAARQLAYRCMVVQRSAPLAYRCCSHQARRPPNTRGLARVARSGVREKLDTRPLARATRLGTC
jgi:hypothetical protein